jgi:hypothetical protein
MVVTMVRDDEPQGRKRGQDYPQGRRRTV